jgi:2-keto-4-pentenoate hydratase/2-oxohepta-3-ene-1,7-dioic acid hydratase in catechol pathway
MKIIRFEDSSGSTYTAELLNSGKAAILSGSLETGFAKTGVIKDIARLLPPLLPVNIFAVGFNYLDHITETGGTKSEYPVLFMKATSTVTAHGADIVLPACETRGPETDYEGELAVIIGKSVKNTTAEKALDYVFGYTCANDVSARRWQKHAGAGQWIRGKSFDTFCPLGPHIVTADELGSPQNLKIETTLNGKTVQSGNTEQMMFTVAEIISYISQDTTLLPGTVILTGTPDGVGFTRNPRIFLKSGDNISVTIEKIGTLQNSVAAS